ncbi:MAG: ATP-binding protein, partial [Chloroflexota bacterium]
AMGAMHDIVHRTIDLLESQSAGSSTARDAIRAVEAIQHGPLYELSPVFGLVAALVAGGLGLAMARSVVEPVQRMGEAMRRLAAGDFSQSLRVDNRDELGELAERINATARDLARLQEAALAEERARALRERVAQITLTQEEERRRIARELHDGLGPSLAALGNRLRVACNVLHADPQRAEREMGDVAQRLKGHVQEIRQLIYDLRPLALDQLGLAAALRQHVERFSQETGIPASFAAAGDTSLNPLADVTVFRIVQECLSNVQQHAGATRVEVCLEGTARGLTVTVADDGRGFRPDGGAAPTAGRGLGLVSMRERADLVGGTLTVESTPGAGCRVVLHVPATPVVRDPAATTAVPTVAIPTAGPDAPIAVDLSTQHARTGTLPTRKPELHTR